MSDDTTERNHRFHRDPLITTKDEEEKTKNEERDEVWSIVPK